MPDNPGVRIPPPLFYAAAVIGGWALNRRIPLPVSTAIPLRALAWIFVLMWAALTAASIGLFRRSRTSMIPVRPASNLVIRGPYRMTRNPMYVALALLTIGLALFINSWWPIILLVPTLVVVQQFVIAREESYLRRRFGDEYDAYTKQVRRWL
jgi:protein-S-isoprenylcysteine O-methyltransferase Ste14